MTPWPWLCVSCGQHYAAFRVYARTGYNYNYREYLVCAECGSTVPDWVENPRGGWSDVYHTILRPVPAGFDPITNPYPRQTTEKQRRQCAVSPREAESKEQEYIYELGTF